MSDLVECQRCGRKIVFEATKKVGLVRVCPRCVGVATQEYEQQKAQAQKQELRAKQVTEAARAQERELRDKAKPWGEEWWVAYAKATPKALGTFLLGLACVGGFCILLYWSENVQQEREKEGQAKERVFQNQPYPRGYRAGVSAGKGGRNFNSYDPDSNVDSYANIYGYSRGTNAFGEFVNGFRAGYYEGYHSVGGR